MEAPGMELTSDGVLRRLSDLSLIDGVSSKVSGCHLRNIGKPLL
jgi:hypothetical protein